MNSRMWSNKKIIKFLNEVRIRPELWNVSVSAYRDRKAKFNAWSEVAAQFNITPDVAYKKFRNLRTYAKTEHKKKGGKDISWFAYDAISFILSGDESESKATLDESLERDDDYDGPSEESSVSSEETHRKESIRKEIRSQIPEPLENVHISDSNYNGRHLSSNLSFGEYVANKLNNYDSYTRSQVEFKISKILFDADMGMFRKPERQFAPQHTTKYSDQQEVSGGGDLKTQCNNYMQAQDSISGPSNVLATLLNK